MKSVVVSVGNAMVGAENCAMSVDKPVGGSGNPKVSLFFGSGLKPEEKPRIFQQIDRLFGKVFDISLEKKLIANDCPYGIPESVCPAPTFALKSYICDEINYRVGHLNADASCLTDFSFEVIHPFLADKVPFDWEKLICDSLKNYVSLVIRHMLEEGMSMDLTSISWSDLETHPLEVFVKLNIEVWLLQHLGAEGVLIGGEPFCDLLFNIWKIPAVTISSLIGVYARARVIPFPFSGNFLARPVVVFQRLREFHPKFQVAKKPIYYFKGPKTPVFGEGYMGKDSYKLCEPPADAYNQYDCLTDYFQEPARMAAHVKGFDSPLFAWMSGDLSDRVVEGVLKAGGILNTRTMRDMVFQVARECTGFRITLGMAIIQFFGAKKILDPCAGWGDRMLAAMASDVECYRGYDPNKDLQAGYNGMKFACSPGDALAWSSRFVVEPTPFEDSTCFSGYYDLVLTSPPYHDFEWYSTGENQAGRRYPLLQDWMKNFFFVMIRKAWRALKVNGHLAMHLSDISGKNLVEPFLYYLQFFGKGAYYKGVLWSLSFSGIPRPIWVFQKVAVPSRYPNGLDRKYVVNKFSAYFANATEFE